VELDDAVDHRVVRREDLHRPLFVGGHHAAVADRIRGEDRGELALDRVDGQGRQDYRIAA